MTPLDKLKEISDGLLASNPTEHGRETVIRAFIYAEKRLKEGSARNEYEAKLAMAAFADGFCTGYSEGSGKPCPHGRGGEPPGGA